MQPQALTLDKQIVKTVRLDYLLWLPQDYDAAQPWPLILFLHGSGERGSDAGAEGARTDNDDASIFQELGADGHLLFSFIHSR